MVYNRHKYNMKKTLFVLFFALPILFAGCEKEDIDSSGYPPQYIDFVKINSWIGTSTVDIANELLQLGFEQEDGDYGYKYLSMEPYYFVSCSIFSTDGTVQGASTQYIINVDSYNTTLKAFKDRVMQERQLHNNIPEHSSGTITWYDMDDDDSEIPNHENYNSYEELLSAADRMNNIQYIELRLTDYYTDRSALTIAEYSADGLQWITMLLESR